MNLLVTGGAGYIGGVVSRLLIEAGHRVAVYDNLSHSERSAVAAGATFIQGDVGNQSLLGEVLRTHRPEAVLHFAALIEAGESMQSPGMYFNNNSASSFVLFQSMVEAGVKRLVFSSTAAVYGEPEKTPIEEDAKLEPTNPYGESKLLVERVLQWMHRVHGLRYASLRYFNVAGAIPGWGEMHEPESHLIPLVLDVAAERRKEIRIFGTDYPTPDGTCVRDYIHVRDLAQAHILALAALEDRPRMIYNLGNGHGFSVREVIASARRVTGHPIPVEECGRRPGDPAILVASSRKIARELGWKPQLPDLDQIVSDAWQWHQRRRGLRS